MGQWGWPELALFWPPWPGREPEVTFSYFLFWILAAGRAAGEPRSHLHFPLWQLPVQLELPCPKEEGPMGQWG